MAHSVSYSKSLNSDISRGSSSNKNNARKASPSPKQVESREAERQRRQSEFRVKKKPNRAELMRKIGNVVKLNEID